jgi:hypothetical protein
MRQMLEAQGDSLLVRNLLKPLAEAYSEVYHNHQRVKPDFYGLRDFYALVRDLHRGLQNQPQKRRNWRQYQSAGDVEFDVLRRAVSHNFNGQGAEEFGKLLKIFLDKTKIVATADKRQAPNPLTVVKENLAASGRVRHLMLLTKNDAALQILLDFNIVQHEKTKILFGSDYVNDQNDTYVCRMIQQIRMSMERGDCLILLHQDNLYESLYDLLNQVPYNTSVVRLTTVSKQQFHHCPRAHSDELISILFLDHAAHRTTCTSATASIAGSR